MVRAVGDSVPRDGLGERVVIAPIDGRVIPVFDRQISVSLVCLVFPQTKSKLDNVRAADSTTLARTGPQARRAGDAPQVRDAVSNGIRVRLAKVVAKLDLSAGERTRSRRRAGRQVAEFELWVDGFGLGDDLFHGAVEGFDFAGGYLNVPDHFAIRQFRFLLSTVGMKRRKWTGCLPGTIS